MVETVKADAPNQVALKDLVWFPVVEILRSRFFRWQRRSYPFAQYQPTKAELNLWWAAWAEAEERVVDGLPWSDEALEAVAFDLYRKATGQ